MTAKRFPRIFPDHLSNSDRYFMKISVPTISSVCIWKKAGQELYFHCFRLHRIRARAGGNQPDHQFWATASRRSRSVTIGAWAWRWSMFINISFLKYQPYRHISIDPWNCDQLPIMTWKHRLCELPTLILGCCTAVQRSWSSTRLTFRFTVFVNHICRAHVCAGAALLWSSGLCLHDGQWAGLLACRGKATSHWSPRTRKIH